MVQTTSFKVAEIEIKYSVDYKITDRPKVNSSEDAYRILVDQWDLGKISLLEEFKIILLNRGNRVLGITNISQGGISGTVADPKLVFGAALMAAASYLILVHNHPSGNIKPSTEDIRLTKKLVEGGKLLDILVVDHLVITQDSFYSFCDEGLL